MLWRWLQITEVLVAGQRLDSFPEIAGYTDQVLAPNTVKKVQFWSKVFIGPSVSASEGHTFIRGPKEQVF